MYSSINWERAYISYAEFSDDDENKLLNNIFLELKKRSKNILDGSNIRFTLAKSSLRNSGNWKDEISKLVQGCGILVPVVSPGYFGNVYCQHEYAAFKKRNLENQLYNCIAPIYFRETAEIESNGKIEQGEWREDILNSKWSDWRKIRDQFDIPDLLGPMDIFLERIVDLSQRMKVSNGDTKFQENKLSAIPMQENHEDFSNIVELKFRELSSTQKRIIRRLHKMPRDEISVDDLFSDMRDYIPDIFESKKELLFRLKVLELVGLVELKQIEDRKTMVRPKGSVGEVLTTRNLIIT